MPSRGSVGVPHQLSVEIEKSDGVHFELIAHPDAVDGWFSVVGPFKGNVTIVPAARGAFTSVKVRTRSDFPLGLLKIIWWSEVTAASPLYVAPTAVETVFDVPSSGTTALGIRRGDELVGLREYVAGDLQRDIHWQSVARTGTLMVKDRQELQEKQEVTVVAETSQLQQIEDIERVDFLLGSVRFVVERLWREGFPVRLITTERSLTANEQEQLDVQPKDHAVVHSFELLERLAKVVPGSTVPFLADGSKPLIVVAPQGVRWL